MAARVDMEVQHCYHTKLSMDQKIYSQNGIRNVKRIVEHVGFLVPIHE